MAEEEESDWMTREGAVAQAKQIKKFWRARGYHKVEVRTKTLMSAFGEITVIESNMVDGVPPR
jgi:hypothetical protein